MPVTAASWPLLCFPVLVSSPSLSDDNVRQHSAGGAALQVAAGNLAVSQAAAAPPGNRWPRNTRARSYILTTRCVSRNGVATQGACPTCWVDNTGSSSGREDSSLGGFLLAVSLRHRMSRMVLTGQADKTQRPVWKKTSRYKLLSCRVLPTGHAEKQWVSSFCPSDCPLFGVIMPIRTPDEQKSLNKVICRVKLMKRATASSGWSQSVRWSFHLQLWWTVNKYKCKVLAQPLFFMLLSTVTLHFRGKYCTSCFTKLPALLYTFWIQTYEKLWRKMFCNTRNYQKSI